MRWLQSNWRAPAAAILTGVLFLLSRDIGPVGALALIAPVPVLLYALTAERAVAVGIVAFCARVISTGGLLYAYGNVFPPAILVLITVALTLEFTGVVLLTRFLARRMPTWAAVFSFPVLLTSAEFLLRIASANGSFNALGYSLIDLTLLAQVASVGGVWALSFVAALVAMTVAMLLARPAQRRSVLAAGLAPLVIAVIYGGWRLAQPYESETCVGLAAIDALQVHAIKGESEAIAAANAYAEVIAAFADEGVDLVVLPERMFAVRPNWSAATYQPLQRAAASLNARIVAGFDEILDDGRPANTARLYSPAPGMERYLKRRMVPGFETQFAVGTGSLVVDEIGVAICKDLDFPPVIREYGRADARLLLVPAWDFGADGILHARMAVMRGIENGFALARAAANGRLTVSDAYGRIIAETSSSAQPASTLVAKVGIARIATVYTRIGDAFAWIVVALASLMCLWASVKLARRAGTNDDSALAERIDEQTV